MRFCCSYNISISLEFLMCNLLIELNRSQPGIRVDLQIPTKQPRDDIQKWSHCLDHCWEPSSRVTCSLGSRFGINNSDGFSQSRRFRAFRSLQNSHRKTRHVRRTSCCRIESASSHFIKVHLSQKRRLHQPGFACHFLARTLYGNRNWTNLNRLQKQFGVTWSLQKPDRSVG